MSINKKVGLRKVVVIFTVMMLVSSSLMFPVSIPKSAESDKIEYNPALVHVYYDKECEESKSMVLSTITPLVKQGILVHSNLLLS